MLERNGLCFGSNPRYFQNKPPEPETKSSCTLYSDFFVRESVLSKYYSSKTAPFAKSVIPAEFCATTSKTQHGSWQHGCSFVCVSSALNKFRYNISSESEMATMMSGCDTGATTLVHFSAPLKHRSLTTASLSRNSGILCCMWERMGNTGNLARM